MKPAASKAVGGTVATIRDTIDFHRKSTGSIDIQAKWTDPVDDLTKPGPEDIERNDRPDHILVDRPGDLPTWNWSSATSSGTRITTWSPTG